VSVREFELVTLLLNVVEQSHVLDRDHSLVGQGGEQLNLPLREGSNLGSGQCQYPDRVAFSQERNAKQRAKAPNSLGFKQAVIWVGQGVGNLNCSALLQDSPDERSSFRRQRKVLEVLKQAGRESVVRDMIVARALLSGNPRCVGLAQARCRLDQGIEYGLKLERRPADHLKHVGGGGLLLQRFAEISGALAQFGEQARVLDGDDGLGGKVVTRSMCCWVNGRTVLRCRIMTPIGFPSRS